MSAKPVTTACPTCGSSYRLGKETHVYFFSDECIFVSECPACTQSHTRKGLDPQATRQSIEQCNNFSRANPVQVYDMDAHFRQLIESIFPKESS